MSEKLDPVGVELFDPIKAEIAKIREHNASVHFDYETPAGNKDARSHCYKLRLVKGRIAEAHKIAKADALKVCQTIDALKRDLTGEVEEMIEVHAAPIREIEEREAKAKAEEAARIQAEKDAEEQRKREEIEAREQEIAKREAEIRAREEEQRRKEREAEIRREAEDRAKREAAEEANRRVAEEKARAERLVLEERMRAEREKRETEEKAERERLAREADERRKTEEEAKRIANAEHRERVENDAIEDLRSVRLDPVEIVDAIKQGEVRHVAITY